MQAAVIFLVALTARLVHLHAFRDTPLFDLLLGDARSYDAWGQRLAAGDWLGTEVFYQAPLYPYFLGLIYALAGHDLLVVRLVQALIGGVSAALLAVTTRRIAGRRAAWLAGLGLGLYAPAIFLDLLVQKSVLDLFFVCLMLALASRLIDESRPALWLALGATLGLLSLTRENALALVLVAVLWAATRRNRHEEHEGHEDPVLGRTTRLRQDQASTISNAGQSGHDEKGRSTGTQKASVSRLEATRRPQASTNVLRALRDLRVACFPLLLGLAIVLLPVVVRNYAVTGGFYLTTSQFGPNFYIGNNPGADGTYMALRPGRGAPEFERQDATELAERAVGRALTPAEVSSYWTDRAVGFITGEPGRWLALLGRKLALLVNADEMLDTESQETYQDESPLLRTLAHVGHFGVVVPLALVGFVAAWPERRRLWPFVAFLAAYAASVVIFYVFARYRFPLVPFLILFAAIGVTRAPSLIAAAAPARRAGLAVAVVLTVIAVNWPLLSPARMRAITETNLGTALHESGRLDEAVARYERALTLQPDYLPAYNNLGVTLRAQGKVDGAIAAYQRGLAVGDYPDLHYNLANALLVQNRADEAAGHLRSSAAGEPDSAGTHNNLGTALAANGQFEQAAAEFRAAIALDPGSAVAHRNLGNALASAGRADEAYAALSRAVELAPRDAAAHYDLGSLLLASERFPEAAIEFRAALALDPRSVETLNNLGIALASQGQLRDAASLFEQALTIDPNFPDAKRNLETARKALGKRPE